MTGSNETLHAKDSDAVHPGATPVAADIMNRRVQTIAPDMDLAEVTAFLVKHNVSNAPVVKQEGGRKLLLGFVTEKDCLEYLANELFYGNPSPRQTAETIMTKHPVCVGPDADIFTLTSILTNHPYRHLPVVEDQNLLGIVSRREIIKALDQYYQAWNRTRDRERLRVDMHQIINHRFLVTK